MVARGFHLGARCGAPFSIKRPRIHWVDVRETAEAIAEAVRGSGEVRIYAHIDPDGITSGSIASAALERAGVEHRITFLKKLSPDAVEAIKNENPEMAWFTDLGSGMLPHLAGLRAVITDHHVPAKVPKITRMDLLEFSRTMGSIIHLNPHLHGLDGGVEISSAGLAYMVARALASANANLLPLAVVGALGDQQDRALGRLSGLNAELVLEGCRGGSLECRRDLRLFGRETRPLHRLLQYSTDPALPRLSRDEEACIVFCVELGVDLKDAEGAWRRWCDLQAWERRRIVSELVRLLLEGGHGHGTAERLLGEVYLLAREKPGSFFRDGKEYATLLNACGRYDHPEIGMRLCLGDRGEALDKALALLKEHRDHLVESLGFIEEKGVESYGSLQFYHGRDRIRDTVIGVTAGMLLNSPQVARDKPLIAFANAEDGVKVSARAPRALVDRGLDLAAAMRQAAEAVGGFGGGHGAAAGATIPSGREEEFLNHLDAIVRRQLQDGPPG